MPKNSSLYNGFQLGVPFSSPSSKLLVVRGYMVPVPWTDRLENHEIESNVQFLFLYLMHFTTSSHKTIMNHCATIMCIHVRVYIYI